MAAILTINGDSSSMRFAVYEPGETLRRRLDGKIDRIGLSGTNLTVNDPAGKPQSPRRLAAANHQAQRRVFCWTGSRHSRSSPPRGTRRGAWHEAFPVTYGSYFTMAGDDPYEITVTVTRTRAAEPVVVEFSYEHGTR